MEDLKNLIEKLWDDRSHLSSPGSQDAIREVVDLVDRGVLRVAEPDGDGWKVNDWVKKAIVLFFPIQRMETIEAVSYTHLDVYKRQQSAYTNHFKKHRNKHVSGRTFQNRCF